MTPRALIGGDKTGARRQAARTEGAGDFAYPETLLWCDVPLLVATPTMQLRSAELTSRAAERATSPRLQSCFNIPTRLQQSSLRRRVCNGSRGSQRHQCQAVQQSIDEQALSSQDSKASGSMDVETPDSTPLPDGMYCCLDSAEPPSADCWLSASQAPMTEVTDVHNST